MADYNYTISVDFGGSFNFGAFKKEVDDSAITGVTKIDRSGDAVTVTADAGQQTAIDALVTAHDSEALFTEHQDKKKAGTFQSTFQNSWRTLIDVKSKKLAEGRYQLLGSAEIAVLNGGRGDEAQIRLKIDGVVRQNAQNALNTWQSFAMAEYFNADGGEKPAIVVEYRLRGNGGDTAQARRVQIGWSRVGPKKLVE